MWVWISYFKCWGLERRPLFIYLQSKEVSPVAYRGTWADRAHERNLRFVQLMPSDSHREKTHLIGDEPSDGCQTLTWTGSGVCEEERIFCAEFLH
jgi:hypothetical protein